MRIMLVADKPDLEDYLRSLAEMPGSFLVHYQHPLKALDNLSEIKPDLVIWDHNDFPRHWKICAAWCRDEEGLSSTILTIISDSPIGAEEKQKSQAFPSLRFIENDYYSDEFASFIREFIKQPAQATVPQKPPAKFRKITLGGSAGSPILLGDVVSTSASGLIARFSPSHHAVIAANRKMQVYPRVRGSGNSESVWLKLQVMEVMEDSQISFVCL